MTQTHKNHNLFCNISNKLHIKNPRLEVNQPLSIYHLPTLGKVAVDSEPEGLQLGQKRLFFKGKFVSLSKNPALPFFFRRFQSKTCKLMTESSKKFPPARCMSCFSHRNPQVQTAGSPWNLHPFLRLQDSIVLQYTTTYRLS